MDTWAPADDPINVWRRQPHEFKPRVDDLHVGTHRICTICEQFENIQVHYVAALARLTSELQVSRDETKAALEVAVSYLARIDALTRALDGIEV